MKPYLILGLFLFFQTGTGSFNRIAKINQLKDEAQEAYTSGNYTEASQLYLTLMDTYNEDSEEIRLNYAHSLHKIGQQQEADATYRSLAANASNKNIQSAAYQQLGIKAVQNQNLQDAVTYFKQSLKSQPENESARYNYELAKKKLQQQQEDQEQDQQPEQPDPSEWAKELKKQAEQLVQQYRYQEAYDLMQQGLEQDPTVAAFGSFINRIGTIIEIEQL